MEVRIELEEARLQMSGTWLMSCYAAEVALVEMTLLPIVVIFWLSFEIWRVKISTWHRAMPARIYKGFCSSHTDMHQSGLEMLAEQMLPGQVDSLSGEHATISASAIATENESCCVYVHCDYPNNTPNEEARSKQTTNAWVYPSCTN
jgi:hypothetical protein